MRRIVVVISASVLLAFGCLSQHVVLSHSEIWRGCVTAIEQDDSSLLEQMLCFASSHDAVIGRENSGENICSNLTDLLFFACRSRAVDCLTVLSKRGVDYGTVDGRGRNALHFAARLNPCDAVKVGEQVLLTGRIDINGKDNFGVSPLGYAFDMGNYEFAKWLLENGASLERWSYIRTTRKKSYLAGAMKASYSVFEYFVDKVYSQDADEISASELVLCLDRSAEDYGERLQHLIRKGAIVSAAPDGLTGIRDVAAMRPFGRKSSRGGIGDVRPKEDGQLLHLLANEGFDSSLKIAESAIVMGIDDVDVVDSKGITPLWCALKCGNIKYARWLVKHGASLERWRMGAPGERVSYWADVMRFPIESFEYALKDMGRSFRDMPALNDLLLCVDFRTMDFKRRIELLTEKGACIDNSCGEGIMKVVLGEMIFFGDAVIEGELSDEKLLTLIECGMPVSCMRRSKKYASKKQALMIDDFLARHYPDL